MQMVKWPDAEGNRQEAALVSFKWPVWPCEVRDIGPGELERLADVAWVVGQGFRPSPPRAAPGAVFVPKGLWEWVGAHGLRGGVRRPSASRDYFPVQEGEHVLSAVLRLKAPKSQAPAGLPWEERLRLDWRPDVEQVRAFVSTYGMLGVGLRGRPEFPLDSVDEARRVLAEVRRMLVLLSRLPTKGKTLAEADAAALKKEFPLTSNVRRGGEAAFYRARWRGRLNAHLRGGDGYGGPNSGEGVFAALELNDDGTSRWGLRVSTLADALWAALLFRAASPRPLVQCEWCSQLFAPSKDGQRFCPGEAPGVRSRCLNASTVKRWRQNNPGRRRTRVRGTKP